MGWIDVHVGLHLWDGLTCTIMETGFVSGWSFELLLRFIKYYFYYDSSSTISITIHEYVVVVVRVRDSRNLRAC